MSKRGVQLQSGIYAIHNVVNGNEYVGSSTNIRVRWREHRLSLNTKKHHSKYLQRAWDKYGASAFEFLLLEETSNLVEREKFYFSERKPVYNVRKVVDGRWTISDAAREKLRVVLKGNKRGVGHTLASPMKGKKRPASVGKKISDALRGKTHAGVPWTDEAKHKMSLAMRGNKNGVGRKHSAETRAKMSASMMGNQNGKKKRV